MSATANGHRPGCWTVEPCVYARHNPSGALRYMARVTAGSKRFSGPWVPTVEEALEHRDVLRARAAEYAKEKRSKLICGQHFPLPEVIYFIQAGDHGPIKIGRTKANLIEKRLANLQIASPIELRIIAMFEGNAKDEAELQRRLDHLRIRGEWFADTPELRKVMVRRRRRGVKRRDGLTMA